MRRWLIRSLCVALPVIAGCSGSPTAPTGGATTPADGASGDAQSPAITAQPESRQIASGQSASLSVRATGSAPLRYQWFHGVRGNVSNPVEGATSRNFETAPLTATRRFWVRVSNAAGSADSETATLTVGTPATNGAAPTISSQPQRGTITSGESVTLRIRATGTNPLRYQWYIGQRGSTSEPIAGATRPDYSTPPLEQTTRFWARVSNAHGSVDSAAATITVVEAPAGSPPAITRQPSSVSISPGQTATLDVRANGTEPLTYQWYRGASGATSNAISGATSRTFRTPPLNETTRYWVRVTNDHGSVNSGTATVSVTATSPDPPSPPPDPPSPLPVNTSSSFENQVVSLVNQRRAAGATCGSTAYPPVGALSMNAQLRTAARDHSVDMASNNYFSHTGQDGRSFDDRIWDAGYSGSFPLGENIAAGQSTPQAVVNGWMSSPGHCANIMKPGFEDIGVGYAHSGSSTYGHYWTQNFGGG